MKGFVVLIVAAMKGVEREALNLEATSQKSFTKILFSSKVKSLSRKVSKNHQKARLYASPSSVKNDEIKAVSH